MLVHDLVHAQKHFSKLVDKDPNGESVRIFACDLKMPREITRKMQEIFQFFEGQVDHVILCHGMIVTKGVLNCTIPNFD